MIRPLLFIPSPRDIPEVIDSISKLRIDKLWLKYYPQLEAYDFGRQSFLEGNHYTHFIIHPDDLLVTQENLDKLLESAYDKVISGWCTTTMRETWKEDNKTSFSYSLPYAPPRQASYESYNLVPVPQVNEMLRQGNSIIPVKFSGFVLQSIPRAVLEKVRFRTDFGCCPDNLFSIDLHNNGIAEYVNLRVRTEHLRRDPSEIQTGKKERRMIFEKQ